MKDQFQVDKAVFSKCKRKKTNLITTWIDYGKAYDMVPYK